MFTKIINAIKAFFNRVKEAVQVAEAERSDKTVKMSTKNKIVYSLYLFSIFAAFFTVSFITSFCFAYVVTLLILLTPQYAVIIGAGFVVGIVGYAISSIGKEPDTQIPSI